MIELRSIEEQLPSMRNVAEAERLKHERQAAYKLPNEEANPFLALAESWEGGLDIRAEERQDLLPTLGKRREAYPPYLSNTWTVQYQ